MQTDRGNEFLNRPFQDMLKREGIDFHVCRNPDVKCAVVERVHRTLRNKLYRYFTYKNTYRFVDVLPQFVKLYDTVHSSNGMAPSAVIDMHVLDIWTRMYRKRSRACVGRVRFRVGQHVRISKEKDEIRQDVGGGDRATSFYISDATAPKMMQNNILLTTTTLVRRGTSRGNLFSTST